MSEYEPSEAPRVSGWAVGGITFAATIMVLLGVFQAIAGLVAIFDDNFYVVTRNYTFDLDTTAWGWIHLIIGILLVVTGYFLFAVGPGQAALRSASRCSARSSTSSSSPTTRSGRSSRSGSQSG